MALAVPLDYFTVALHNGEREVGGCQGPFNQAQCPVAAFVF
jgi:hypothetical protein